jgi:hypothetical protein
MSHSELSDACSSALNTSTLKVAVPRMGRSKGWVVFGRTGSPEEVLILVSLCELPVSHLQNWRAPPSLSRRGRGPAALGPILDQAARHKKRPGQMACKPVGIMSL